MNKTEIVAGLWQGAWGPTPREEGRPYSPEFGVVISMCSCAPPAAEGQRVHHFPIVDPMWAHEMNEEFHRKVELASDIAVQGVRSGQTVMVLCAQGRNRSGIVVAMALHKMNGWSGSQAMKHIQQQRPGSLYNVHLQRYLDELPPASWRMMNS